MSEVDELFEEASEASAEREQKPRSARSLTRERRKADRDIVRAARRRAKQHAYDAAVADAAENMRVGDPQYAGPLISLNDVTRFFPGPPPVNALRGVDLTVDRGEYLAIIGPSGSGKSTMLNTLGLLDRPSTGQFLFEGIDVGTLEDNARAAMRASAIGFVFQSFHLMPTRTVLENTMLAGTYAGLPREEREQLARSALDRVGLSHRVDFFPRTLSGGERQRVAIARAVSTSPRLLLADEPTGNLDRENSQGIMRLFDELGADGLTIVMITHDNEVAQAAKRRVRMHDGSLTEVA